MQSRSAKFLNFLLETDQENELIKRKTGFWGKKGAGCLIQAKSTGRILVGKRSLGFRTDPGKWCTWGGALDEGENPETAMLREMKEESGYTGPILSIKHLYTYEKETGPNQKFQYFNFLVVIPEEFDPNYSWEVSGCNWFTSDQLKSLNSSTVTFGLKALLANSSL